jgi:hypothetical protein
MKYNILTVASKQYIPFLDIFLTSLFKNGNTEDLNKVYIVDIDLGASKDYFIKSDKIVYLNSNQKDIYSGIHSEGWYKNVSLKTQYLHKLLCSDEVKDPIILIDSDVLVLKDISKLIDLNYDMQFTTMSAGAHTGASGIEILQIGCFVACNNLQKSKTFIELWMASVYYLQQLQAPYPHETPAMNIVINLLEHKLAKTDTESIIQKHLISSIDTPDIKIGYLDDKVSCSDRVIYPQSYSLHFKTNSSTYGTDNLNDFINRISNLGTFSDNIETIDFNDYINSDLFSLWSDNQI